MLMEKDPDGLQQQIDQLSREVGRLRGQVKELEAKRDSQEIIIDALVEQTRILKRAAGEHPDYGDAAVFRGKKVCVADKKDENKEYASDILPGIDAPATTLPASGQVGEKGKDHAHLGRSASGRDGVELLTRQIKTIFQPKQKTIDFKPNYSYRRFIEYAECSYEFSLMNKKVSKAKNPMRLFIESNLDKVMKYIIDNINQLNLNQICSALFLISSEIEYKHKLIIMHDCVLEVDQHARLPYIASALFNNLELRGDALSTAVKKILYHQYRVDRELFVDEEVGDYLELIKHNFSLERPGVSLWESPGALLAQVPMFHDACSNLKVRNECIENGFIVRMLCHYLDWDFTYNTFIVEQLFPKLKSESAAVYAYYLGILAVDAFRTLGKHDSIAGILQELLSIMGDSSDVSVVCFLITKQFYEAEAERWLENNIECLERRGFSRRYLTEFLLL